MSFNYKYFSKLCVIINIILLSRSLQRVFGVSLDRFSRGHISNRNRQRYDANRLKRHKSFSCPQLLISDTSASLDEPQFKHNTEDCNQNTSTLQLELGGTDQIYNTTDVLTYMPNQNLLQPHQRISTERRHSESLPKDIHSMPSFRRKLGTVSNPLQSNCFKDNENEICPMLEKNRL